MTAVEILLEGYGRIETVVRGALKNLNEKQLAERPGGTGNSAAWLVWHISRGIDGQIASLAGSAEVWTHKGWSKKFNLPLDESSTGYGHTSEQVDAVKASTELLLGYFADVNSYALAYLKSLSEKDLDEVIDKSWDPPVTRGIRLVSILGDVNQHAGQAAYLHGLLIK